MTKLSARLEALAEKATSGPWAYRPDEYDEWGGEAILLNGEKAILIACEKAIATMFERLRTPSEEMLKAGEHAWMNRDLNDPASHPIRDCFRAMLTAFQQENSECRE